MFLTNSNCSYWFFILKNFYYNLYFYRPLLVKLPAVKHYNKMRNLKRQLAAANLKLQKAQNELKKLRRKKFGLPKGKGKITGKNVYGMFVNDPNHGKLRLHHQLKLNVHRQTKLNLENNNLEKLKLNYPKKLKLNYPKKLKLNYHNKLTIKMNKSKTNRK